MSRPELIQTVWARTIIGTLVASGIEEMIVSPGSRSTPLVAAAVDLGVPCRAVVDERSAAFFALGAAKVTGAPLALLCTSGSAPAHYLPAVIEAAQSDTPLVVVSADRPSTLHGCRAPQTVDQQRLFGAHCRWFVDLGAPSEAPAVIRGMVRAVRQAVSLARSRRPGPVHLNVPLCKPLAPVSPHTAAELDHVEAARSLVDGSTRHWSSDRVEPPEAAVEELAAVCDRAQRGVIVLGPASLAAVSDRHAVVGLAEGTGFPVLAEGTSQHRFHPRAPVGGDAFELLAGVVGFDEALLPDFVLQLGAPPTAAAWGRVIARHPEVERWVVAAAGWPDPHGSARGMLTADPGLLAAALVGRLGRKKAATGDRWRKRWARATETAWRTVDEALAETSSDRERLAEGAAVRAVAAGVPANALLAVGNGLPVRSLDWYLPARTGAWKVWCQRGASGIDGVIAGACGAAVASGGPVVVLLGDVAFAHDVASLAIARSLDEPLVLVVLDNVGGRIFELLPEASTVSSEAFERLWLTPSPVDPVAVATAFGVRSVSVATAEDLVVAVRSACVASGPSVVRVAVDPSSVVTSLAEIRRRLQAHLGG